MYCVTSYRLGYKTDVQSPWKSYMENGNDKVLGTGRDGTLTEMCSLLAIGYSLSLGVGGAGGGGILDNIYPIYRYFCNIFRTTFLGS